MSNVPRDKEFPIVVAEDEDGRYTTVKLDRPFGAYLRNRDYILPHINDVDTVMHDGPIYFDLDEYPVETEIGQLYYDPDGNGEIDWYSDSVIEA